MKDEMAPFQVEIVKDGQCKIAQVKPCCKEDNIFYYDVSIDDEFQFSMTMIPDIAYAEQGEWKVALVNADKKVDPELVKTLGAAIEFHLAI